MDFRKTTVSSARLLLKAFEPEDAADIFSAITPNLTKFMAFDPSPSFEAFSAIWPTWIPKMAAGTDLFLVIRLAQTGESLGIVGLHGTIDDEPEAGVWIKESAHGHGYGREAVSALIAWAASATDAEWIIYPVVEQNHSSRRVAEALHGIVVGARSLKKAENIEHPMVVYRLPVLQPAT